MVNFDDIAATIICLCIIAEQFILHTMNANDFERS